jgi:hypothetical protein
MLLRYSGAFDFVHIHLLVNIVVFLFVLMAGLSAGWTKSAAWLAKQLTVLFTGEEELMHVEPILQTSVAAFLLAGRTLSAASPRCANTPTLALLPVRPILFG